MNFMSEFFASISGLGAKVYIPWSLSILFAVIAVWVYVRKCYEKKCNQRENGELRQLLGENKKLTIGLEAEIEKRNEERYKSIEKVASVFHDSAASLERTTARLRRVEEIVTSNSKPLEQICEAGIGANNTVKGADSVLRELQGSLNQLFSINGIIEQVNHHMLEIDNKTKIINAIASQAKILSVNASIEAARAGEHGRGFAIVADDISRLSEVSKDSAKDIGEILKISINHISKISKDVEEKIGFAENCTKKMTESFTEISYEVSEMDSLSRKLSDSNAGAVNEIIAVSSESKTDMESMSKTLSDVLGIVSGRVIVDLEPAEVADKLEEYTLIDVRAKEELNDDVGHLPDINHYWLSDNFKERIEQLDHCQKYLFICRSGGRSARAARIAQASGFENVYNLAGGMLRWREAVG